ESASVGEFAISPGGDLVAYSAGGEVTVVGIDGPAVHLPAPAPAPALAASRLRPRPRLDAVRAAGALRVLDAHPDLGAAPAGRAIAQAWDCGRLVPAGGKVPLEREVAGILGEHGGDAAEQVAVAEARVVTRAAALLASTPPSVTPLAALAAEFGLS